MTAGISSETEGAAEAIHNGQYDITKLQAAEKSAARRDEAAFAPRLASALAAPASGPRGDGGERR
jgi:hypothetical protein